jgi:hypothetical protein
LGSGDPARGELDENLPIADMISLSSAGVNGPKGPEKAPTGKARGIGAGGLADRVLALWREGMVLPEEDMACDA